MTQAKSRSLRAKTAILAVMCLFWMAMAAICGLAIYVACLDTEAMCISAVCSAAVCMFGVWYAYCDFQETPEKS